MRILGIDPGSRKTGFGIIEVKGNQSEYLTSGKVKLTSQTLPERLKVIYQCLQQLITEYQPDQVAIEEVFFARDPRAALKLGQARGAAMVAAATLDLPVAEYSARAVKKSVVGSGAANKEQVQHMVRRLLNLPAEPGEDAADALAVALCHAQTLQFGQQLEGVVKFSRGRIKLQ